MFNKKQKFLGAVLVVLAVIITGILIYNYTVNKSLSASSFPKTLQGLSLGQVVSGPQAMAMISELHGSNIAVKQGYIASYGGNQGQIMIWISESNNSDDAAQLFKIMDQKISQPSGKSGQPPFTNRKEMKVNGRQVISVQGMGMENYYYQNGAKVYWVAVGGVDPIKTLDEVMNAL